MVYDPRIYVKDPAALRSKLEELALLNEKHNLVGLSVHEKNYGGRGLSGPSTEQSIDYALAVTHHTIRLLADRDSWVETYAKDGYPDVA